jgi:2-polyprenyl-6-methoxyphenol hydroxylase-like FAD-dependent oxidoreductase
MYSEPGRSAVLGGPKAPSLFIFKADRPFERGGDKAAFLRAHFTGCGWRVPPAVEGAGDVYMDELVRTRLKTFTRGRVALVGDAGYANTLGGFGTGLALMGAYVLAGELVRARKAGEDFGRALRAYDAAMLRPTEIARTGSGGQSFLAPPSWLRIYLRNLMFKSAWAARGMVWIADWLATEEGMPEYELE